MSLFFQNHRSEAAGSFRLGAGTGYLTSTASHWWAESQAGLTPRDKDRRAGGWWAISEDWLCSSPFPLTCAWSLGPQQLAGAWLSQCSARRDKPGNEWKDGGSNRWAERLHAAPLPQAHTIMFPSHTHCSLLPNMPLFLNLSGGEWCLTFFESGTPWGIS